jgi:hypothetical protein
MAHKNVEDRRAYGRKWSREHPEQAKKWRIENRDRYLWLLRDAALRRKYGIGCAEFDVLAETQNYVCAICQRPDPLGLLSVDHDHVTGVVRGLLCRGCNTSLGRFNDDVELLQRAIDYLNKLT